MNTPHKKECCNLCRMWTPRPERGDPCGKKDCKCHTPPQEKGWIKEFDEKFSDVCAPDYSSLISENKVTVVPKAEAIKSFIQEQITATEERVRKERDKTWEAIIEGVAEANKENPNLQFTLRSLINNK